MRGHRESSGSRFSYVSIEERIPASQSLRWIRGLADQALDRLNPTFCEHNAAEGRPFQDKLMADPAVKPLLSVEHFSVDGTLLQGWTSHASLERIDGALAGALRFVLALMGLVEGFCAAVDCHWREWRRQEDSPP